MGDYAAQTFDPHLIRLTCTLFNEMLSKTSNKHCISFYLYIAQLTLVWRTHPALLLKPILVKRTSSQVDLFLIVRYKNYWK